MAFIRSFDIFLSFTMGLNTSLPTAGGLERDDLQFPSKPNHPIIPFYG